MVSKQELAYQAIRQAIRSGVFGPGARIVIDELARELGCSPIPVREAVRRLEAEGLIEYTRNTGARVVTIDERDYVATLATLAVLEGYASAVAAARMGPADLEPLRDLTAAMHRTVDGGDMLRYSALNRAYHETIYRHCDNAFLVAQIEAAWARLDSMRHSIFVLLPQRARASVADHERITDLIARRAPALEIELAVREHKLATAHAFHEWVAGRQAAERQPEAEAILPDR
ncbi:MAG: GntR family transcriptional regulator [Thermomicrobiaceae bacterium]|nr:GntR family transcriptional regulator [Thermomicrobiaceae bacterium]